MRESFLQLLQAYSRVRCGISRKLCFVLHERKTDRIDYYKIKLFIMYFIFMMLLRGLVTTYSNTTTSNTGNWRLFRLFYGTILYVRT